MIESEAKEILEAYMECYRRKTEVAYDYQCDKDCEACGLNYEQGTVGEHNEAVIMAINALEKQEKIKEAFEMWKDETVGYYGADDETTKFMRTLIQILRSDEE